MKSLSKEEIVALFDENKDNVKRYKKQGKFIFRNAIPNETVLTIVAGKLETMKTAGENEKVLRNIQIDSSAECYIIPEKTFNDRYDVLNTFYTIDGQQWQVAIANGLADGFEYLGDEDLHFYAPWGEEMFCKKHDFIVNAVNTTPDNIYRIERATFDQTYKLYVEETVEK
jgi:tellurite resistance-related uncharacterized protein